MKFKKNITKRFEKDAKNLGGLSGKAFGAPLNRDVRWRK